MEYDRLYQLLRDEIIWLKLAPESALNLNDLAARFSVSRTPVKEALILLMAEGWVRRQGSSFVVTPLSLDRIKEITEIRMVMEVEANLLAMQRITAYEETALDEIMEAIAGLPKVANNRQLVELDFKFHHVVFAAARNGQLAQYLERLLALYMRFWLASGQEIDRDEFFRDTKAILTAITARDEASLRAASVRHIKMSYKSIQGVY